MSVEKFGSLFGDDREGFGNLGETWNSTEISENLAYVAELVCQIKKSYDSKKRVWDKAALNSIRVEVESFGKQAALQSAIREVCQTRGFGSLKEKYFTEIRDTAEFSRAITGKQ